MTRARDVANLQSGAIINEAGADLDFRIESDDNANMFFIDGGNDKVGIGTNSPTYALDVESNNSGGLVAEFVNTATSIPQGVLINFPNNTPNVTNRFFLKMEDSTSVKADYWWWLLYGRCWYWHEQSYF
jgi:hypothetical protein